jgi:hypothetical protein
MSSPILEMLKAQGSPRGECSCAWLSLNYFGASHRSLLSLIFEANLFPVCPLLGREIGGLSKLLNQSKVRATVLCMQKIEVPIERRDQTSVGYCFERTHACVS